MIDIVLVDDHQLFREALTALLAEDGALRIVGVAADGQEALGLVAELRPHVVVMDVAMPSLNGVEATRELCKISPESRVVALSMHANRQYIAGMFEAGAIGFVLKSDASSEVVAAIQAAARDERYMSPRVAEIALDDYVGRLAGDRAAGRARLSPRERQILQLFAEGHTAKSIALQLHISSNTVETHKKRIMEKLQLTTIAALTKYAIQAGLTSPDP